MRKRIIYGILKSYKGIFVKKHIGNSHLLIIEMKKSFWVLNLLGVMTDGREIAQLLLRAPSQYINEFLDSFENDDKFVQLEEIFCEIPNENESKFKLILKKKGKHLNSHITIEFAKEFSDGNIKMYIVHGKFNLIENDIIQNKAHLKMKSLKKKAVAAPLMSKFMSSLKR